MSHMRSLPKSAPSLLKTHDMLLILSRNPSLWCKIMHNLLPSWYDILPSVFITPPPSRLMHVSGARNGTIGRSNIAFYQAFFLLPSADPISKTKHTWLASVSLAVLRAWHNICLWPFLRALALDNAARNHIIMHWLEGAAVSRPAPHHIVESGWQGYEVMHSGPRD